MFSLIFTNGQCVCVWITSDDGEAFSQFTGWPRHAYQNHALNFALDQPNTTKIVYRKCLQF